MASYSCEKLSLEVLSIQDYLENLMFFVLQQIIHTFSSFLSLAGNTQQKNGQKTSGTDPKFIVILILFMYCLLTF